MSEAEREAKLDDLYRANLQTLFKAIDYCHANGIRLVVDNDNPAYSFIHFKIPAPPGATIQSADVPSAKR